MKTIAVDMDGVLSQYHGWEGDDKIGFPILGAREGMEELKKLDFHIVVHTTRGDAQVKEWLGRFKVPYDEINVNSAISGQNRGKPVAAIYLDDRAIVFNGSWKEAIKRVKVFQAWWEGEEEPFDDKPRSLQRPYYQGQGKFFLEVFEANHQRVLSSMSLDHFVGKKIILVVPCSWGKPYSRSYIHYHINCRLYLAGLLEECSIWHISNVGIVPSLLESEYPYIAYDWCSKKASKQDLEDYRRITARRFLEWSKRVKAIGVNLPTVIYLRENGNSIKAVRMSDLEVPNNVTLIGCPLIDRGVYSDLLCGGLYEDADDALIAPECLDRLVRTLRAVVKV